MKTSDFDFYLPQELIASSPTEKRDLSRLFVIHRDGRIEHRMFFNIHEYLRRDDMLLLNNTKVFPARIVGKKPSGGMLTILLVRKVDDSGTWEIMHKGSRFRGTIIIGDSIKAEVWTEEVKNQESKKFLRFLDIKPSMVNDVIWQYGNMPLPPYIRRMPGDMDKERYQTVYSEKEGSIAAPTAGLHFTDELLDKIKNKGINIKKLTLHVGPGTFKPIKTESPEKHCMDREYFEIDESLLEEIKRTKESGNRLKAVGTTSTRAIEGYFSGKYQKVDGSRNSGFIRGYTDIFIYPGYKFKAVDSLITNFHLPASTPLMLVSAMRGFENISAAYREAIAARYRFFSYGDAMLIL